MENSVISSSLELDPTVESTTHAAYTRGLDVVLKQLMHLMLTYLVPYLIDDSFIDRLSFFFLLSLNRQCKVRIFEIE